jgi:hypothetical protein
MRELSQECPVRSPQPAETPTSRSTWQPQPLRPSTLKKANRRKDTQETNSKEEDKKKEEGGRRKETEAKNKVGGGRWCRRGRFGAPTARCSLELLLDSLAKLSDVVAIEEIEFSCITHTSAILLVHLNPNYNREQRNEMSTHKSRKAHRDSIPDMAAMWQAAIGKKGCGCFTMVANESEREREKDTDTDTETETVGRRDLEEKTKKRNTCCWSREIGESQTAHTRRRWREMHTLCDSSLDACVRWIVCESKKGRRKQVGGSRSSVVGSATLWLWCRIEQLQEEKKGKTEGSCNEKRRIGSDRWESPESPKRRRETQRDATDAERRRGTQRDADAEMQRDAKERRGEMQTQRDAEWQTEKEAERRREMQTQRVAEWGRETPRDPERRRTQRHSKTQTQRDTERRRRRETRRDAKI